MNTNILKDNIKNSKVIIFDEIKHILDKKPYTPPTISEKIDIALEHIRLMCEEKGEEMGVKEARKHIAWYIKGLKGSSQIKTEVFKIGDFATMAEVLTNYIDKI